MEYFSNYSKSEKYLKYYGTVYISPFGLYNNCRRNRISILCIDEYIQYNKIQMNWTYKTNYSLRGKYKLEYEWLTAPLLRYIEKRYKSKINCMHYTLELFDNNIGYNIYTLRNLEI